jgi:glycerol-3-phosphate dehydrogenase
MQRDLDRLATEEFDLLIIGAGILGASIARDAALRGLSVALIDRGDFGSGTSANCLKIVHGGLRYLAHLDLRRMRQSIRERSTWLRVAPHLVSPLPVIVPTFGYGMQARWLLRAALAMNDLLSADRNKGITGDRHLPNGRALSRAECLASVPELERPGLTGGVMFYDAQMYSADRLVFEVVLGAARAGANVANHVAFESGERTRHALVGARVRDVLGGTTFTIRAGCVVNAAGPAVAPVADALAGRGKAGARQRFSLAMNFVVPHLGHTVAFSLPGGRPEPNAVLRRGNRQLFFTPWRHQTAVGTAHYPLDAEPRTNMDLEPWIAAFLEEINGAWSAAPLQRDQLRVVHHGFLPEAAGSRGAGVSLLKHHRIIDHAVEGTPNAISAVSVKYTTARRVAEETVDLVCAKLGRGRLACTTATTALPGAPSGGFANLLAETRQRWAGRADDDVIEHLVHGYGRHAEAVLEMAHRTPEGMTRVVRGAPVVYGQFLYGVEQELAETPGDLLDRRTELGARGLTDQNARTLAARALRTRAGVSAG